MLVYLVDDRGARGEYAHFLKAYAQQLPPLDFVVFTHWVALREALLEQLPCAILLDMRFDETPPSLLLGSPEASSDDASLPPDPALAQTQIRENQGILILRAIRHLGVQVPIVLFATLPEKQQQRMLNIANPLVIIDGLILNELRAALQSAQHQSLLPC